MDQISNLLNEHQIWWREKEKAENQVEINLTDINGNSDIILVKE